jgi:predicted choloylglycine hydrolase
MTRRAAYAWPLTFWAIAEPWPGPAWQRLFTATWPGYRGWYLREGAAARPDLATCRQALAIHMPELVPVWERLVELAGGNEIAARMLSLYNPPPYLAGCSQAVFQRGGPPVLVRNYDYAPLLLERVVTGTSLLGRRVIGMSDCLWGLVDGMNEAGLVASLAFGGRRVVGTGFGIPLVLRYLLEVCTTAAQAQAVLARLPVHMAYNVTVVDRAGSFFTAYLGPDRAPRFVALPVATNHQDQPDWPAQAQATHSLERYATLSALVADPGTDLDRLAAAFLAPPLYSTDYALGFGTLYTAIYRPADLSVEYRWPGSTWPHHFDTFASGQQDVVLARQDW